MKISGLLCLLFLSIKVAAQNGGLKGRITGESKPLVSGSVVLAGTSQGAATGDEGYYEIRNIPPGPYRVIAASIGYNTDTTKVIILPGKITGLNLDLKENPALLDAVVITSLGNVTTIRRATMPVIAVSHDMFLQQASTNVIDAIAREPGITAVTTGPGVSKPEINGLGYNRVLTLMDGERQEDFQWGDEHGILIDPYAVYSAEIIRGPASLQYGANAEAGVVSFRSEPLPEQSGTIQGSVQSEYQTNNGLTGGSVNLAGNDHDLKWDVRGSYEAAHSYWDPHDGYAWGTAYIQGNAKAVLETDKSWGYSRLTVSLLHRQIEIPDGNRDSASGRFEFDVPLHAQYDERGNYVPGSGKIYPTLSDFLSYSPGISSYQILNHDEAWWQNNINAGRGRIGADIGYTASVRHEIDTGTVADENMIVHDIPYSIKYQIEGGRSGLKLTTGFNGVYEFMENGPEPPAPYIGDFEIPDYHTFDIGGYGILEEDFKDLTLSGGLRYDLRNITGQSLYLADFFTPDQKEVPAGTPGAYTQFSPFSNTYTGFSGSIGASYQLPGHYYIKLNAAKSFRAPAISELASNEVNPGAFAYELGNHNLKPEAGYEADVAVGNYGKDVNFEVDGFYNYITNFIFSDRLGNRNGGDSLLLGKPVYQFTANIAIIAGVTAYFNIHPADAKWIEIDNGFTYIYSFMPGKTDSTRYVPWTPAPRLTSEVKFDRPDRHASILRKTYFELGVEHDWPQHDIYSAFRTELPSYAYTLFNAGIGTDFVNRSTRRIVCTLLISCTNLMNIAYVDHTSRTQYFWAYNGVNDPTNFGKIPAVVTRQSEGIYNMGRNIDFKLIFPVGGHKVSDTRLQGVRKVK